MSKLLINDYPILVLPALAKAVGLNEAIFLQQLHYWLGKSTNIRDGVPWVYNSVGKWREQFPFWSEPTIKRIIARCEEDGLVLTGCFNKKKMDRTKWYTINRAKLAELSPLYQSDTMHSIKVTPPIPETTQETTPTKVGASPSGQVEPIKSKPSPPPKKRGSAPPSSPELAYIKSIWGSLNAEMRKRGGRVFSKQQEYAEFFAEVGLNNAKYAMEYLRSPQNMDDQYGWKTAAYSVKGLASNWNKIVVKMREPIKPKPQATVML